MFREISASTPIDCGHTILRAYVIGYSRLLDEHLRRMTVVLFWAWMKVLVQNMELSSFLYFCSIGVWCGVVPVLFCFVSREEDQPPQGVFGLVGGFALHIID